MRQAVALTLAALAAAPAPLRAEPPPFVLEKLVLTGETAPGLESELVDAIGTHEDIFNVGAFVGAPSIGHAGGIGIVARVGGDGRPSTPDTAEAAVWRAAGGALRLLARTGQPAPGTNGTFTGFPSLSAATPADHDDGLAFAATVHGADGLERSGLWSSRDGLLRKVLLSGEALPGAPAGATAGSFAFVARGASVLVEAGWCLGGGCAFRDEGLFRDRDGALVPVVKRGDPAPGFGRGVVFDDFSNASANTGPIHVWNGNQDGRVIFNGYARGTRVDGSNNEGVWAEGPGGLALLAREGERVPGKQGWRWGAGSGFQSFGDFSVMRVPMLNAHGQVLFGASITNGRYNRLGGVWTSRSGALVQVAQTVRRDAGVGGQPPQSLATPAPGFPAGFTLRQIFAGRMNDAGLIVLDADVADPAFAENPDPDPAIYRVRPGSAALELVARRGGAVPEVAGAVFRQPLIGRLFDTGHYLWLGRFDEAGVPALGAFLTLPGGATHLLFRTGDAVDVSGAGDERTVVDFAMDSDPRGGGLRVEQVFELRFSDGSDGAFAFRLTAP